MADHISNSNGTVYFLKTEGYPQALGLTLQPITRPGMDGVAYLLQGSRGNPFSLTTHIDLSNWGTAITAANTYKSMIGTICSITINGTTFNNYLVLDCIVRQPQVGVTGIGGINAGTTILTAEWQLVYAGT